MRRRRPTCRRGEDSDMLHGAPLWLSLVGIAVEEYETAGKYLQGVVPKFLNRELFGLEVARQQWLFDYFARYLEKIIKGAIRDGTYRGGIQTIGVAPWNSSDRRACCRRRRRRRTRSSSTRSSRTPGMDFETAKRKLEETRSAGKDTAGDIDGDGGDDDEGGSTARAPRRDSDGAGRSARASRT